MEREAGPVRDARSARARVVVKTQLGDAPRTAGLGSGAARHRSRAHPRRRRRCARCRAVTRRRRRRAAQGCDLERLLSETALDRWAADLQKRAPAFVGLEDFRRTTCAFRYGVRMAHEDRRPKTTSCCSTWAPRACWSRSPTAEGSFRVTVRSRGSCRRLTRRAPLLSGRAGRSSTPTSWSTCRSSRPTARRRSPAPSRSLVGINGNKGVPAPPPTRRLQPRGRLLSGRQRAPARDRARARSVESRRLGRDPRLRVSATGDVLLGRILQWTGDEIGVEGRWSGNDTVWRTCLDPDRVLTTADPTERSPRPRSAASCIADAMVARQGDGPLARRPLPLEALAARRRQPGTAMDWVGASALGYDPQRVALARGAFRTRGGRSPRSSPTRVRLIGDLGDGPARSPGRSAAPIGESIRRAGADSTAAWTECR